MTRSAAWLAAAAAAIVLAGVSAAGAAQPGSSLRRQAQDLGARARRAALDLYALDSRLHGARARLAALEAQSARLRREQQQLAQQLSATRQTLAVSQRELGDNLSMLYKEGDVSALAVMLGSDSLDDAVTRLDDLNRAADESRHVVAVTADAQSRFDALRATLDDRRTELDAAVVDARSTAAALESAQAARIGFVAQLRRRQGMKTAQLRALETAAQRAVRKSDAIQTAAAVDATPEPPQSPSPAQTSPAQTNPAQTAQTAVQTPPAGRVPAGGRTLTVSTTGYSLPGRASTGVPVGWGVVAVDPAVIPLGTRLSIPGYGEAVAADTGGAIRGDVIDLWFPTLAQARGWGRRTVTITLH